MVTGEFYARTVRFGHCGGRVKIKHARARNALSIEFTHSLSPVLSALLNRIRDLFDVHSRPEIISRHLARDKVLAPHVKANRGIRVPGAFHGFEIGLRASIGQQVTVKAATTIAGRLMAAFGEPIATPFPELNRLTPTPESIAQAAVKRLAQLGLVSARSRSLIALAQAQASGKLSLDGGDRRDPETFLRHLADAPGIRPWTASCIAMRVLRWPDAFPKEDLTVLNHLCRVTAKQAEALSQAWRPWRSYAVLRIWRNPRHSLASCDQKIGR